MNSQQIELVQSTVPVLRENGVALTSYFYKRMLNNHPELKMSSIWTIKVQDASHAHWLLRY